MTGIVEYANTRSTAEWFSLGTCPTGANTMSVAMSVNASDFIAYGISYTGTDTTTPVDAHNGTTGSSTTASQSVTTATDNAIVLSGVMVNSNNTLTVGGGDTQISNTGFGAINGQAADSRAAAATSPAGSKTMSWSLNPTDEWAIALIAVKPAGGGGGVLNQSLTLLGVGPADN